MSFCRCDASFAGHQSLAFTSSALQVPKGASEAQLKRAYRKLALQYHPVSRNRDGRRGHARAQSLNRLLSRLQDKVTGTEDEKKVASQRFADINHGEPRGKPMRVAGVQRVVAGFCRATWVCGPPTEEAPAT